MSYQQQSTNSNLTQFVPNYVVHSDYLPNNRVEDTHQTQAREWIHDYEASKRSGRVFTQRPAEFNPNRYVSVRTYENVVVNQPISENEFNSRVRRY